MKIVCVIIFLFLFNASAFASDTDFIRVHFLYGSTPKKEFKESESKWFGGKLGGHVGIEIGTDSILNFIPDGKFHVFQKKDDLHSLFAVHGFRNFYSILGGESTSNKKVIFTIPITSRQREQLDSLTKEYLSLAPYDYSLFGMRCGAATYDILSRIGILELKSYSTTWKKIFYPKQLRKIMFQKAKEYGWIIETFPGSNTRNWERD